MKLLVLSDSHGQMEPMRLAIKRENPDTVIHLGDYITDCDHLSRELGLLPVVGVRGNCDFGHADRQEQWLCTLEGIRIFAVHGHRYGVKQGLLRAELAARQQEAQLLLFGHTHQPYCECYEGLWLLNPGACSGRRPSYGVVTIENGGIECRLETVKEPD